jgi:hypothetical protein
MRQPDDEPERKLHVEIKPITNGANVPSATVDELKATIEGFNINTSMFNTAVTLPRCFPS